ncbi:hypothetical protein EEI45_00700 [Erysipelothrix piscisicarius]|uniref:Uncharacterized protein n=1 Tax=Erysipelothrix piscisicarius TaxID=2485784 RepID=A0A3S5HJY3_9FIRM|nr:hypothetical protein [Erysipelothrix piscisicarius]AZK43522.1 hypothetical protein EEI45_00700 [Erysipelothrix piscisicarius]
MKSNPFKPKELEIEPIIYSVLADESRITEIKNELSRSTFLEWIKPSSSILEGNMMVEMKHNVKSINESHIFKNQNNFVESVFPEFKESDNIRERFSQDILMSSASLIHLRTVPYLNDINMIEDIRAYINEFYKLNENKNRPVITNSDCRRSFICWLENT